MNLTEQMKPNCRARPRARRRGVRNALTTLPFVVALLVAGCHQETKPDARQVLPTAVVTTAQASADARPDYEELPGTIVPRVKGVLEAKVVGRVTPLAVEPGQAVAVGQLLVRLEAPELQARADQALAALKLAEQEQQRVQNLYARQAATKAEIDAVSAQLSEARAAVAEAGSMLGYLTINAPFAGVVTRKLVEAGDMAAPGKALIEIEQPGGKRFEAAIPEALIGKVKPGATMKVKLVDVAEPVTATVTEINPAGDPGSRSWLVKFDLPAGVNVRSGAFGRVAVPRDEIHPIVVPASAVIRRGQLEQVFVVAGGQATLRLIKTGRVTGDRVEILSGIQTGESVVVTPAAELKDGQPVKAQ